MTAPAEWEAAELEAAELEAAELEAAELEAAELEAAELDPEDAKLVILARGARARAGAAEGAAVRDDDGRTYAAATVALPSLTLTALQAAVAMAVASGARQLEAAVVVGSSPEIDAASRAAAADLRTPVLILADPDGAVRLGTRR